MLKPLNIHVSVQFCFERDPAMKAISIEQSSGHVQQRMLLHLFTLFAAGELVLFSVNFTVPEDWALRQLSSSVESLEYRVGPQAH